MREISVTIAPGTGLSGGGGKVSNTGMKWFLGALILAACIWLVSVGMSKLKEQRIRDRKTEDD